MKANTSYRELIHQDSKGITAAKAEIVDFLENLNLVHQHWPIKSYHSLWSLSYSAHELILTVHLDPKTAERIKYFLQNATAKYWPCFHLNGNRWETSDQAIDEWIEKNGLRVYTRSKKHIERLRFSEAVRDLGNLRAWKNFDGPIVLLEKVDNSIADSSIKSRKWVISHDWILDDEASNNDTGAIEQFLAIQDGKARTKYLERYLSGNLPF